jgi:RNA polymerase sigma factor (sigma-70 family)
VEVSALKPTALTSPRGSATLLRLQSDERLVALTRRGQQAAFEALFSRYQARLLSFCRHMLGSREDAEDVLQEVFAAAFNAILADEREINVRPWLYRIARNRSLNHLRRASAIGVDSMDIHFAEHGLSTGEQVMRRESFRQLIGDVQQLPETQRTALLLREIDALSYEQIAQAMETTVPSVKSLLVRARISLAEAAEARLLSCEEVREQLGEAAEGLVKVQAPARRHLRDCERCRAFRKHLKDNNHALAAILPVGPLLLAKKLLLSKFGSASAGGAHVAGAGGATAGATAGVSMAGAGAAGSMSFGGLATAAAGALATKAAATLAAAAIVTAGAVAVGRGGQHHRHHVSPPPAASTFLAATADNPAVSEPAPAIVRSTAQPTSAVAHDSSSISAIARPVHRHAPAVRPKPTTAPAAANLDAEAPSHKTTGQPSSSPPAQLAKPATPPPPPPPVTQVTSETTQLPSTTTTTTTTATTPSPAAAPTASTEAPQPTTPAPTASSSPAGASEASTSTTSTAAPPPPTTTTTTHSAEETGGTLAPPAAAQSKVNVRSGS